ncbi:uncharacterized protein LOC115620435 [Scaptodrosophila lebanonensis]|uniref:Uncharacterized protein LOC115620435 n=1 Tax=Drosophila lebanonensis TaxID=7225 RepID=A0A6J2T2N0_DROLE|nr:uncharacterized protein LOC115620435 [Scaptodrosophila lebanonensis]
MCYSTLSNAGIKMYKTKSSLKYKITSNLDKLDSTSNAPLQDRTEETQGLQQEESGYQNKLESSEHRRRIKNRRRRDRQKKQKLKKLTAATTLVVEPKSELDEPSILVPSQQQHVRLNKCYDATKVLHIFELLERLYVARGGSQNVIKSKVSHMRRAWRRVLLENESDSSAIVSAAQNLESQWEAVIFGGSRLPLRLAYKKQNGSELLRKRFIWDSYISTGEQGSSIPVGWVIPPLSPAQQWAQFRRE